MKFVIFIMCLGVVACQKQEKQFSEGMQVRLEKSIKRDDISGRVGLFFRSVDSKDWENAKEVLADKVEFDIGAGSSEKSSDDVIEYLKKNSEGVETFHNIANAGFKLSETEFKMFISSTITHFKKLKSGKNSRTLYGAFEFSFLQPPEDNFWDWKITKLKYVNKFTDGNVNLK